jgi:hypothetical protein
MASDAAYFGGKKRFNGEHFWAWPYGQLPNESLGLLTAVKLAI